MGKKFRYLILILSLNTFILGNIFNNLDIILGAICILFLHNIWYACENFSERIVFLAFNGTFFTFLIARLVIKVITDYYDPYNNNKYGLDFQDDKIIIHILITLFISLLFVFIGYILIKDKNKKLKCNNKINKYDFSVIAFVSKNLFYFTNIFNILILLDKAKFTDKVGYMELYASYSSSFPLLFVKLAEMSTCALFVFLATLPNKRKAFIPLSLYTFSGVLSLRVGQRNNFVLNIMIVLIYLCLRNLTDKNKKWFGKKEIISCIVILPIILLVLNSVSYSRLDKNLTQKNLGNSISEFFYGQGVSVNLIGYAKTLENELPKGKNYTFGRIIAFVKNNSISQTLFNFPNYKSQTIESALYGNSFADSISYILSPGRYINGWGYGSSYVAELYKDFGYIGVMIGNLVLGSILACVTILFKKGILGAAFSLYMIRLLLYSPRDTATSFIVTTFNLINIFCMFIIFLCVVVVSKKRTIKKSKIVF